MKTYYIMLNGSNLYYTENSGIFILQAQSFGQAHMIINTLFIGINKDDIKEIDGSLFNFESER